MGQKSLWPKESLLTKCQLWRFILLYCICSRHAFLCWWWFWCFEGFYLALLHLVAQCQSPMILWALKMCWMHPFLFLFHFTNHLHLFLVFLDLHMAHQSLLPMFPKRKLQDENSWSVNHLSLKHCSYCYYTSLILLLESKLLLTSHAFT